MNFVTDNLPVIIGGIVFLLFTAGLVLALRTPAGRDAIAAASVRIAVAALAFAEKWLSRQINGDKMQAYADDDGGYVLPPHPVITAQVELGQWLSSR